MRILATFAAALAATLTSMIPAFAGDVAAVNVLGFSPDGRVFAFEEYGVQDGSGFPYAHRYYLDTATDTFVSGTPIRVMIEDETVGVPIARAQAKLRGEKLFKDATLDANRGNLAGYNAVTEESADPHRLAVNPRPVYPVVDAPLELRLEEFSFEAPERCQGITDVKGFRLLRIDASPNGRTKMLHEDTKIPLSRGCPTAYRLTGIQTFYPHNGAPVYAALIAIQRYGFEGPDYRFIAFTERL